VADAEDLLAGGFVADEFHAALAEDAAIPLQPDFFRDLVPLSMREPVWEAGDQHVHLVADRLQRAAAALFATRAIVVAFGEQQFHQRLSKIRRFGFVDLDFEAVRDPNRTRRDHGAVHLHRAHPACPEARLALEVAQRRDVHTGLGGHVDQDSVFLGRHRYSIDLDPDGHAVPSVSSSVTAVSYPARAASRSNESSRACS
jgi:hypothetical protein